MSRVEPSSPLPIAQLRWNRVGVLVPNNAKVADIWKQRPRG